MLARGYRRQADCWSRKAVPLATVPAACLPASAQMRKVIPDDACAVLARSHKVAGKCMPALSYPDQGKQAPFESCGLDTFCSVRGANAMRPLQAAACRPQPAGGGSARVPSESLSLSARYVWARSSMTTFSKGHRRTAHVQASAARRGRSIMVCSTAHFR